MNDSKEQNAWVYGIVPAGASLDELESRQKQIGIDVWVVELGDLGAIVSDAPAEEDAKALRDQALAHARVLEAAILDAPVVPFRFGNEIPGGDDAVGRELLESRHDEFAAQLEKLKNYLQMTVKVTYDEQAVLRQILESNSDIAQLREQARQGDEVTTRDARVQLGEMIGNALEELRQKDASEIVESLKAVSAAAAPEELESEYMVLNAPFLVERERLSEFEDALDEIAAGRGDQMKFTLYGPMPAYNFLDVEQPAWA